MNQGKPMCPVCGDALRATDMDPNLYFCVKRRVCVPTPNQTNVYLDIIDATINIRPEDGKITWQVIEIPPYRFVLSDDEKGQKTVIQKYSFAENSPWAKAGSQHVQRDIVLTFPTIVNFPWNDKDKLMEKVKLLILFS